MFLKINRAEFDALQRKRDARQSPGRTRPEITSPASISKGNDNLSRIRQKVESPWGMTALLSLNEASQRIVEELNLDRPLYCFDDWVQVAQIIGWTTERIRAGEFTIEDIYREAFAWSARIKIKRRLEDEASSSLAPQLPQTPAPPPAAPAAKGRGDTAADQSGEFSRSADWSAHIGVQHMDSTRRDLEPIRRWLACQYLSPGRVVKLPSEGQGQTDTLVRVIPLEDYYRKIAELVYEPIRDTQDMWKLGWIYTVDGEFGSNPPRGFLWIFPSVVTPPAPQTPAPPPPAASAEREGRGKSAAPRPGKSNRGRNPKMREVSEMARRLWSQNPRPAEYDSHELLAAYLRKEYSVDASQITENRVKEWVRKPRNRRG